MFEYKGIGAVVVSARDNGAAAGAVCKYSENDTVTAAGAGEAFHGVCVFLKNEQASVQVKGFVTMPYTGTVPSLGHVQLKANGDGGVQVGSDGQTYLVAAVDTTENTVTFCL